MSTKYDKGQTWGALKKAWLGYKIAKAKNDKKGMVEYANKIRTLQGELGLKKAEFEVLK